MTDQRAEELNQIPKTATEELIERNRNERKFYDFHSSFRRLSKLSTTLDGLLSCRVNREGEDEKDRAMKELFLNEARKIVRREIEIEMDDVVINWKSFKRNILKE